MPDPIQVSNQSNTSQIQLNPSGLDNELKILVGENSIYIIEPNETSSQQITPNSLYINEPATEPSQETVPNSLHLTEPTIEPSQDIIPNSLYINEPTTEPSQEIIPNSLYINEPTTEPSPQNQNFTYIVEEDPLVAPNQIGRVWGDPAFLNFKSGGDTNKGLYLIMGEAHKTYNLLSDKDIQINSTFIPVGSFTSMGTIGIKLGKDKISFSLQGAPQVNDKPLSQGETLDVEKGTISWDGKNLAISSREYKLQITSNNIYLDLNITTGKDGVFTDQILPHGMLGQTANREENIRQGAGWQGEGVIEGTYKDYEVPDLFSDNFKFNRFVS